MPLSNDSICGAETLPVNNTSYVFNNTGATVQANENAIAPPVTGAQQTDGWANNTLSFTTWFKFTAPASGQIRISGVDQGFDGQVAVYEITDCSDLATVSLLAANDDEIDGESPAPNFTFCGLTAGNEYYLMHDSRSTSQEGVYSLKLSEVDVNAGTENGIFNICSKDTINLFDNLTGSGCWWSLIDTENTFHIVNDSLFSSNGLAYQVYTFEYRIVDGCALDSVISQYEVYPPSQAGDNGTITICKNRTYWLVRRFRRSI